MLIERNKCVLLFFRMFGKGPKKIGHFFFPVPFRDRLDQQSERLTAGCVLQNGVPFMFRVQGPSLLTRSAGEIRVP